MDAEPRNGKATQKGSKMMKKMLLLLSCACAIVLGAFAGDDEVTVKVSVAGYNNSALRKQCEVLGQKTAVKKYLDKLGNAKITDKVIAEAQSSYAKFIGDIETNEQEYEDGERTCSYTVTVKQADIAKWLEGEGVDLNAAADGSSLEIFVMEEPPDAGQMQLGDDVGNFFFTRYNMFQRRIRDALVKKVGEFGFKVILLEDNENYEEMKKVDPVLVGVTYNVNGDTKGFQKTPDFLRTVQENNPDAIALYYRIDALAYDADTGAIRTSVSLNFKNLAKNTTENVGSRDFEITPHPVSKKPDMVMANIGSTVETAMRSLLNGEDMGDKLVHTVKSMRNAAARPKGPMKLVINCSKVESKIKIRVRNGLKKKLIAAGLTDQTKVVKDSLSCVVKPSKEFGDLDDVWGKVSEIIPELLGDDIEITDEWAKKNGDTLTVTIGK